MAINSKKFRDHVWQEVKGSLASNYWLVKMKKRMESEEADDKPNEDGISISSFVRDIIEIAFIENYSKYDQLNLV